MGVENERKRAKVERVDFRKSRPARGYRDGKRAWAVENSGGGRRAGQTMRCAPAAAAAAAGPERKHALPAALGGQSPADRRSVRTVRPVDERVPTNIRQLVAVCLCTLVHCCCTAFHSQPFDLPHCATFDYRIQIECRQWFTVGACVEFKIERAKMRLVIVISAVVLAALSSGKVLVSPEPHHRQLSHQS